MARSSTIVLLSLVFCFACLTPATAQTDKSPDELLLEFGPSVVTVVAYSSAGTLIHFGSGFLLPDGRIVTTAHVLNAAVRVDVIDWEGRVLGSAFHVEALGLGEDLSILPAPASAKHGLTLSTGVPETGSPVLVMGSDRGLKGKVSEGVVREVERTDAGGSIQISAPLSDDLLGGPVLDSLGEVVGVAVAIHEEDETLGRVVPSAEVAAVRAGRAVDPVGGEDLVCREITGLSRFGGVVRDGRCGPSRPGWRASSSLHPPTRSLTS